MNWNGDVKLRRKEGKQAKAACVSESESAREIPSFRFPGCSRLPYFPRRPRDRFAASRTTRWKFEGEKQNKLTGS